MRSKFITKKIASILIMALLVFSIGGCGDGKKVETGKDIENSTYVLFSISLPVSTFLPSPHPPMENTSNAIIKMDAIFFVINLLLISISPSYNNIKTVLHLFIIDHRYGIVTLRIYEDLHIFR